MSQNTLIEKIKQDAATTVAEIKSTGAAEIAEIQRETEATIAELTKSHAAALEKKKAQLELVAVSRAKQSGNIALQSAKRKQIDSVFTEVRSELEGQVAEEYVSFFFKHAKDIIPQSVEIKVVYAPAARQTETSKILENLNLTGQVKEDSTLKAGFIAHASDGVYDVTLDRLMKEKQAELEMNVVNKVMS